MGKVFSIPLLVLVLVPLMLSQCSSPPRQQPSHPLLPDLESLKGWKAKSNPRTFEGEDLFVYINGGADIYNEYGFKGVLVQEYENGGIHFVTLEIFEMIDPGAAYGVYTFKIGAEGRKVPWGQEGLFEDYYLNFWQGKYVVTLTALDDAPETLQGLEEIAEAVDARIHEAAPKPRLACALPQEGLVENSVKYVRGSLGLFNAHPLFSDCVFGFTEAAKGDYREGYSLLAVLCRDAAGSGRMLEELKRRFSEDTDYNGYRARDDGFRVKASGDQAIFVESSGSFIILGMGNQDTSAAESAINELKRNLESFTL